MGMGHRAGTNASESTVFHQMLNRNGNQLFAECNSQKAPPLPLQSSQLQGEREGEMSSWHHYEDEGVD